jgi:hypothetical protein
MMLHTGHDSAQENVGVCRPLEEVVELLVLDEVVAVPVQAVEHELDQRQPIRRQVALRDE